MPVLVSLLVFTGLMVRAQEPAVNLTGTWKVTHSKTNIPLQAVKYTLKLTMIGGTLGGTISHVSTVNGKPRVYEWPIKDAKFQGDEITFKVSHPFEVGQGVVTSSYRGKVTGDTIEGTFKTSFLAQTYTRDWTAERVGQ